MTLSHLRVRNLGVLADASIDPSPGFTVITGETGAGKTLLLGGIRLILGAKTDAGAVGPDADTAQVDGMFVVGDNELGLTRVVPRVGRSRAHLDGVIVSAAKLADSVGDFVEIVGQHDQLAMTRPSELLGLLDTSFDSDGVAALDEYRRVWSDYQDLLERRSKLGGDTMALTRELDLLRYQAGEIAGAGLAKGLDIDLETRAARLRNVEEITEHLADTLSITEQTRDQIGEMISRLRKIGGLDASASELAPQAEALAEAVGELRRDLLAASESLENDPTQLAEVDARLTAIGELKRKYGRTIEDVMAYGEEAAGKAAALESMIADADRIETKVEETRRELRVRADRLGEVRGEAAADVERVMGGHLADLALAGARVEIRLEPRELGPAGGQRMELLFASDDRMEPQPVSRVASGGELSRLILALRLAIRAATTSTLVFDEVDTGLGGKTALAMGEKLAALAASTQVLCVTHLPQVAARADKHYVVERAGSGVASVRVAEGEDRVREIARMLAGLPESDAGRSAAAELLAL